MLLWFYFFPVVEKLEQNKTSCQVFFILSDLFPQYNVSLLVHPRQYNLCFNSGLEVNFICASLGIHVLPNKLCGGPRPHFTFSERTQFMYCHWYHLFTLGICRNSPGLLLSELRNNNQVKLK